MGNYLPMHMIKPIDDETGSKSIHIAIQLFLVLNTMNGRVPKHCFAINPVNDMRLPIGAYNTYRNC